jgi:hypothetical protein
MKCKSGKKTILNYIQCYCTKIKEKSFLGLFPDSLGCGFSTYLMTLTEYC